MYRKSFKRNKRVCNDFLWDLLPKRKFVPSSKKKAVKIQRRKDRVNSHSILRKIFGPEDSYIKSHGVAY